MEQTASSTTDIRRGDGKDGPALPLLAGAGCFALILLGGMLADRLPPGWDGNWTAHVTRLQPHVVDRFFPFDAAWYGRIASDAYVWLPSRPDLKQDVAFFPLWPILLRLLALCVGSPMAAPTLVWQWGVVALAGTFGLASIVAFHRLAMRVLPAEAARVATLLFAFYPGASFLLLSYPTGLMNLLCILAVLALLDGRFWTAALFSGLVTGIGPLGLGTALTVCGCAAADAYGRMRAARWAPARLSRAAAGLAGLCLLSVSGLVLFLLWQYLTLGDALAFIKAQEAWSVPPAWWRRILPALTELLILPDFLQAGAYTIHTLHARSLVAAQASVETALHHAALGIGLIGVLGCMRLRAQPVLLQAVFTLAVFIWFHGTTRPGNSTLRLTYCAIGVFLGLAWLLQSRPLLARAFIGAGAALLGGAAFLVAAGYHVT